MGFDFVVKRGSRRASFFRSWKTQGYANVWLHPKTKPQVLWAHMFPRVIKKVDESKGINSKNIYSMRWNCAENSHDLMHGMSPKVCPICRYAEYIRDQVVRGQLNWLEPVIRVPGENTVFEIAAGGVYGEFNSRNLTDAQKTEMRRARISQQDAWRQNVQVKMNYMFYLVDNDAVYSGLQIATESSLIGECVQKAMNDWEDQFGSEKGDITRYPQCMRWEVDKDASSVFQRYSAKIMPKIEYTPEIQELLASEPIDLGMFAKPADPMEFRMMLEQYSLIELPYDELFAPPKGFNRQISRQTPSAPLATKQETSVKSLSTSTEVTTNAKVLKSEEFVVCDQCNSEMYSTDMVCKECGAQYGEPTPPPVAKRRTRKSVLMQDAPKEVVAKPPTEVEKKDFKPAFDLTTDDVPF
jgi:hypothetical protein